MNIHSQNLLDHSTHADIQRDILVVSRVFPPDPGGIQEYAYNRCLQNANRIVVLSSHCSGANTFDAQEAFPIHRWPSASITNIKKIGGAIKQLLFLFWEVVFSIQLFLRYRYRFIEWAHGYDFPAILILSYILPIRFFVYLHGDDVLCPLKNPFFKWLFELTLQRAAAISCNSSFTQNYLQQHFRISTPIAVIHPTVRPDKFGSKDVLSTVPALRKQIRAAYHIPDTAVVILSVGRLVRRKGFNQVIEHLPKLLESGLDIYYFICGTGPMESELKALTTHLNISNRVIFLGYVCNQELASFYAACDVFSLITSFDQKAKSIEGFGIVYLEAGYFSKPVIAARSGGVEDAVLDGETGILVEPGNTEEIYTALSNLCLNPKIRKGLGYGGYRRSQLQPSHAVLYSNSLSSQSLIDQKC